MSGIELGIIGGSGLYQMDGLTDVREVEIDTPFGKPSDAIIIGTLHGREVAFLPRHARGHLLSPTEVPYRANIYALKSLGVKYIVAVNACGSLQEEFEPGHIVVPDQLFDHTTHRPRTFFEKGLVAHVSVADPMSPELAKVIVDSTREVGGTVHEGGNFIIIEGPRFSTKGESNTYRNWGMSIIGMTCCPEAFLAAEAEIAYASMAHITDYDVWHESEEAVTVDMVIETLSKNTQLAKDAISHIVSTMDDWAGEFPVHTAMEYAILTDKSRITDEIREKYRLLAGRYLGD